MTDSRERANLRVPRARPGVTRSPSTRSSAAFEDFRPPPGGPAGSQALRGNSSRISLNSLNEQFASTRQEYELWDDDGSSIYERLTNASEAGDPETGEKILMSSADGFGLLYHADEAPSGPGLSYWDYYDILCLPRDGKELSQEQIRSAYYRLFLLFYPDSYPEHLRPIARQQFLRAQEAFETLIDPIRRAQYDLDHFLHVEDARRASSEYETAFKEAVRNRVQNGIQTSSDLGIRLDASRSSIDHSGPRLLDFALSHSVTVDVPSLRKLVQPQVSRLERLAASKQQQAVVDGPFQPTVEVATPTLTVSGSTYGIAGDSSMLPTTLLYDRYQPLLPLTIPRNRLIQLVENRLSPLVTLRYRQEFLNRSPISSPDKFRWVKTAIELESDILPELSATSRLYHQFTLPNFSDPTTLEYSIQSSRHEPPTQPRITLGLHQKLYHGTGFLRADSGDWVFGSGHSGWFSDFSRMNPNMFSAESPLKTSPTLELGFRTGSSERVPVPGSSDSPGSESGIRGLDHELNSSCNHGTWAISASATPTSAAGLLRYSKDLDLPFQTPSTSLDPGTPSSARVEVELCSNTFQDRYLALRNLWSVGRFARIGLELGISLHNLHLSVYWSRLGQRLSVPLLIAPRALIGPSVIFWAGALPFVGLAALELGLDHRRRRRRSSRSRRRAARAEAATGKANMVTARHRYEADNVTVLLAQAVEGRQKRQMTLGGLVILSAKYGVPSEDGTLSTGEQVADVTIGLAALVDDSPDARGPALSIPRGVRKSRLPGFWDPAPGRDKVLRVEYSFRGVADVVEVGGREELILPPQA
ncbi:J domain-containing protein [Fusarium keratoplasticum]|nr:J domain-containing protein [Fusarium keratoplasticum]